jgi:hypothetical protein
MACTSTGVTGTGCARQHAEHPLRHDTCLPSLSILPTAAAITALSAVYMNGSSSSGRT